MSNKNLWLLSLLAVFQTAAAGQAEICYTPPTAFGVAELPNNATVFTCPITGAKTLPQLAALGWEAVQLTPVTSNASGGAGSTHVTQQLIIQKS